MLANRSYEPELLDAEIIPEAAFTQMLKEINNINTWLGGHNITVKGFKSFSPEKLKQPIHVVEIGSGGGDNLKVIYQWCKSNKVDVKLTGIDIRPECVAYAEKHTADFPIEYIISDYKLASLPTKPDIIFNSLFCHHFKESELVYMLRWMQQNSRLGFFINDLHRHVLAFKSIQLLTRLFSKSYMVKYDAPLSVKRGFTLSEWRNIFEEAGIQQASIEWKWAFRHLIIYKQENGII
ncbi:MAG: methyltransferase domain-containing protein [Bacteroidota bacterium]